MTAKEEAAPDIVALIPAFNEERTIGTVIRNARWHVRKVVVVDDGSQDNTREASMAEGAVVLSHPKNLGYGSALASGFKYVRGNGSTVVVVLDGDGQHNPSDIPRLVAPILDGRADITIGSRFMNRDSQATIPTYRRIGISIVNHAWAVAAGHVISDTQCGYRAYSDRAVRSICIKEHNMSASLEILSEIRRKKLRIVEVPVMVSYTGKRSSVRPGRHGVELVNYVLREMREDGFMSLAGTVFGYFRGVLSNLNMRD